MFIFQLKPLTVVKTETPPFHSAQGPKHFKRATRSKLLILKTMHTIKLKIEDSVYDKFIWFLGKFTKDEVEVIIEDTNFSETKNYLESELNEIKSGKAIFFTVNETEQRLENLIKKHEGLL
jgi:hypothetical protein